MKTLDINVPLNPRCLVFLCPHQLFCFCLVHANQCLTCKVRGVWNWAVMRGSQHQFARIELGVDLSLTATATATSFCLLSPLSSDGRQWDYWDYMIYVTENIHEGCVVESRTHHIYPCQVVNETKTRQTETKASFLLNAIIKQTNDICISFTTMQG